MGGSARSGAHTLNAADLRRLFMRRERRGTRSSPSKTKMTMSCPYEHAVLGQADSARVERRPGGNELLLPAPPTLFNGAVIATRSMPPS